MTYNCYCQSFLVFKEILTLFVSQLRNLSKSGLLYCFLRLLNSVSKSSAPEPKYKYLTFLRFIYFSCLLGGLVHFQLIRV